MSKPTNDILHRILNTPEETQSLEFKRLSGEKIVSKTIETIAAMANTNGGTVVFGVDYPEKTKLKGLKRIFGIEENKENFDAIEREIQNINPPMGNLWNPQLITIEEIEKTIAILHIPKATHQFHAINNQIFIRQLKGNKKLNPHEIVKFNYAKGFEKADKELVDVDLELLDTNYFQSWREARNIEAENLEKILFDVGLARKDNKNIIKPTRAAVMLFAKYPTNIMDTKCAVRIFQYMGKIEDFQEVPNLAAIPKTIDGPIIKVIKDTHEHVLTLLRSGLRIESGFINKYQIPQRAVKEAITNAIIHRDYHIKRDIEISIFEDRIEILSPGLFPYNITQSNIGHVRADGYRNDLLVKHLREFPNPPNLDRNEGVRAMRNEMNIQNLYDPVFVTYPHYQDSVKVTLLSEERPGAWEKVRNYLETNTYVTNSEARKVTNIVQLHTMSKLFKKWTTQGLLVKIDHESGAPKLSKYKLAIEDSKLNNKK